MLTIIIINFCWKWTELTLVAYALVIPSTPSISNGPIPEPNVEAPDRVLDDVTNGYVP